MAEDLAQVFFHQEYQRKGRRESVMFEHLGDPLPQAAHHGRLLAAQTHLHATASAAVTHQGQYVADVGICRQCMQLPRIGRSARGSIAVLPRYIVVPETSVE